jgi:hypothetical protein
MATGTQSSAQSQTASQPAALRSGETLATTLEAAKDPKAKTYYHRTPGAKFVMPDGLELIFLGGQFSTTDAEIIRELNKVVDKPASMIYSARAAEPDASMKQAAEDAAKS